jgi:hypothetical protein
MAGDTTLAKKFGKVNGPCFPFQTQYPKAISYLPPPATRKIPKRCEGFPLCSSHRLASNLEMAKKKRSTTALAVICMSSSISCQNTADWWLLKFHTYGLLNNSFQPPSEIRALHTYWRQRGEHVQGAATCVQRMQKALTQTNVQLANQSFGERLSQSNWRGGR